MTVLDTSFGRAIGASIQDAHRQLAERWLERLVALVPVEPNAVFSTALLLDHVPTLIEEIGKYVSAPADEDIAAKTIVIDKARELGELRHRQQASVHQVLREYDLLAEVIEEFLIEKTRTLARAPEPVECLEVSRRIGRAVRVLMQITAVKFVSEYMETITDQAQRLDRFNRAISHELRNVLGTLQFGAALFENGAATGNHAELQRLGPIVGRNVERAVKIIRSFERLPRTGIVADKPSEQVVQVTELVQEVFRQLQEMSDLRSVELRVAASPAVLFIDTGALELVLMNLVSNAIKYSDKNKPERFAAVEGQDRDGTYVISVRDNGIGIPGHAVSTLFDRFVRAHPHLDEELGVEGTGLGLAIVDECVKSLRGEITFESQEGVGTTFVLTIPKKLPVRS
jgi:signal transduction histidine kinase